MGNTFDIQYTFTFENEDTGQFAIAHDTKDLSFVSDRDDEPPLWAKLGLNQCKLCTIDADKKTYCPVAANKDANVNALVNLDCFATAIPMTAEDMLNEIKNYFTAY